MTTGPGTLLVVDDDELNRDMLSRRLVRQGYRVVVSADGAGALAEVAGGAFDLVLLDVMMPGLSGLEVLKSLRERYTPTGLPVIMATARDQSEDIVQALQLGANDYVTKPLDFAVVQARIETQVLLKRSGEQVLRLQHDLAERNQALEEANARLTQVNRRMEHDLATAARIQASLLPRRLPTYPRARFSWHFEPCDELAGDGLNVVPLDDRHVGLYVLDVSGHGVASALLSVMLARILSPPTDPLSVLVRGGDPEGDGELGNHKPGPYQRPSSAHVPPAEVADELGRRFPFDPATGQYFTLLYGVIDLVSGVFESVSAGHPGLVYLPADGSPRVLEVPGYPIGLAPVGYESRSLQLEPGDRVFLYSDGITEAVNAGDVQFGARRLLERIESDRSASLDGNLAGVLEAVHSWSGEIGLRDDISLLAFEFGPARTTACAAGAR